MMDKLWISWNHSRRTKSLAEELRVPLFEYVNEKNTFIRHLFSSIVTIHILIRKKPLIIYIQYSYLLLLILYGYKKLRRKYVKVICDCHTKALRKKIDNIFKKPFSVLKRISFKAADISLISNEQLAPEIKKFCNRYFILHDPIPKLIYENKKIKTKKLINYCVYSNSYQSDEPYDEVIKASKKLDAKVKILCTGRIPKKLHFLKKQPYDNIFFTDYIQDYEYYRLIANAQCILSLSKDEATLLCAGYEALSVNIPLVTSDTKTLREYFHDSVIFTKNWSDDIAKNVELCLKNKKNIKKKMQLLRKSKTDEINLQLTNLKNSVDSILS
jgi:glycosyltransferase involved in cell wall biosynthesis